MSWEEMRPLLTQGSIDTLYMVGWSGLLAVLGGLPLGVLLVLTDRGGLLRNVAVSRVLGVVVNVGRSLPFIILLVALIPVTRLLVGTAIGPTAAVVPLAVGAVPFFARLVETAVREVDHGLVEAAQAMGGSVPVVVRKVLLPQALPSLTAGLTTTVIALIGYSAMAGAVGGGGLGTLALNYGYRRSETDFHAPDHRRADRPRDADPAGRGRRRTAAVAPRTRRRLTGPAPGFPRVSRPTGHPPGPATAGPSAERHFSCVPPPSPARSPARSPASSPAPSR
jgi:D-methionine transport system permease protein